MPVSWGNIARSTIYVPYESNWLSDLGLLNVKFGSQGEFLTLKQST